MVYEFLRSLRTVLATGKAGQTLQTVVETTQQEIRQPIQPDSKVTPEPLKRPPQPLKAGEAIRILFVAQHPSIWPSWRSVHRAMSEHPDIIVKVVLTPFMHPASSVVATMSNMQDCLISEGIPFVTLPFLDLEQLRPHVVFLQNPYDETRPDFLKSGALISAGARSAYIPYGLEVGGGAWNLRAQFDLPVQRTAWRIFARSERHKRMYATYNAAGNSNVVVTGHPKFDAIPQGVAAPLPKALTDKIGDRKVVLWTPHFSVTDTPSWSTYRLYADSIFSVFSGDTGLFLLLRPHPLFFKSMTLNGVWGANGESELRQRLEDSPNMALEEGADYHATFAASDALMTDVGSFLLEYLPTGKPLLYLHHPRGLGMNDEEELTESLYRASCAQDIEAFVQMIESGNDPRKPQRESIVADYLSGLDQSIGQRICEAVVAGITSGDDACPGDRQSDAQWHKDRAASWRQHSVAAETLAALHEKKQQTLRNVLNTLPALDNAIDMGCGDGTLTLEIARHAKLVQAFDYNADAIARAKKAATELDASNVSFLPYEFYDVAPLEKFDLVTCLDATRCIIDDTRFAPFLKKLKALAHTDAHLLISETLSLTSEQRVLSREDGPARFRSIDDMRWVLRHQGLVIQEEILIETIEENLVNTLFVLRPAPTYRPSTDTMDTQ